MNLRGSNTWKWCTTWPWAYSMFWCRTGHEWPCGWKPCTVRAVHPTLNSTLAWSDKWIRNNKDEFHVVCDLPGSSFCDSHAVQIWLGASKAFPRMYFEQHLGFWETGGRHTWITRTVQRSLVPVLGRDAVGCPAAEGSEWRRYWRVQAWRQEPQSPFPEAGRHSLASLGIRPGPDLFCIVLHCFAWWVMMVLMAAVLMCHDSWCFSIIMLAAKMLLPVVLRRSRKTMFNHKVKTHTRTRRHRHIQKIRRCTSPRAFCILCIWLAM